jgi:hypothetical protein
MDEKEKSIDESWKETVAKEKESPKVSEGFAPPEPDFSFFVTTLSLQASIALGKIPNPGTNQKENNPEQAKFIIDTLAMLKEKTKGNLNKDEDGLLENLLYELRMEYISLTKERLK